MVMTEKPYPTDLSDEEWALIEPLLGRKRGRSHEQDYSLRRIVEASFYVLRGGIPWRMMPHDFPPWEDVYYHLRKWRRKGTWGASSTAAKIYSNDALFGPIPAGFQVVWPLTAEDGVLTWRTIPIELSRY